MRLALALAALAALALAAPPAFAEPADAAAQRDPVKILATGDSMIQLVDHRLAERIGPRGGVVKSDARISTGISKPLLLDWRVHARKQVADEDPVATVVFLGANDGFDMPTPAGKRVSCCGAGWIAEYARRARQMMRTYADGGARRVYWLLLPQAREGFFAKSYPAVNAALRRAARGLPRPIRRSVELVHLNRVFTPGGRYRDEMRWRGRLVRVRQADGVHLNPTGADIAAQIVAGRMRADSLFQASP